MKKILITPRSFPNIGDEAYDLLFNQKFLIVKNETGKTFDEQQMLEKCSDIDGIIVGVDPITEKVLRNAKKLKVISKYGVGLDNIDLKVAKELGIKVVIAAGTNAISVAELTIGYFFIISKHILDSANSVKNGGWGRTKGMELYGKTVGILGYGNIGKEVARMSYGLGMNVIVYDPYINPKGESISKYSVEISSLDNTIKSADFLTLHLPLNESTNKIINIDTLSKMKPTAYLINTARGGLVDEDALYSALILGEISGAASDVFSKEPPNGDKLLELDNFILTSHIGAYTKEANERMALVSSQNLIELLRE